MVKALEDALVNLQRIEGEKGRVSVGQMKSVFQRRGFGPLLLLPALILLLPTGAIPGMPLICGTIIAIISLQLMFGKAQPWLPARLERLSIKRGWLDKGAEKAMPYAKKVDRCSKSRLNILTSVAGLRFAAFICLLLGLLVIPLGAIPMAVTLPSVALFVISLGASAKDGLFLAIGIAFTLATIVGSYFLLT